MLHRQAHLSLAHSVCYTGAMPMVQRHDIRLRLWFSPACSWLGQVCLIAFLAALVLSPLSLSSDASRNEEHPAHTFALTVRPDTSEQRPPRAGLPVQDAQPPPTAHEHCAIHCSLASLLFPLLLLGALFLTARLGGFLPLGLLRLATPPLSPPPQPAR